MQRTIIITLFSWILFLYLSGCGSDRSRKEMVEAQVQGVMGRYVNLGDKKIVAMVGVHVPLPGEKNFRVEYLGFLQNLLGGKEVMIRTVEKKHHSGYPYLDLVEVYLDGTNVNRELLRTGMAFFNEDHWDKGEKKEYRELERTAMEEGAGIWANKEKLEVLFIRPKKGRFIHYPDCHHVRDLEPEERVNYYAPIPRTPFMAARIAYFCDHCRPRFDKQFKKQEEQKVKLQS